ncbi:MAG: hypothetical protein A3F18_05110 [Legionellales bacterium RIFCSPHIGHO2_12_FULL_37_14]|nr:MAG: hypothetical protein A3F18_05110 [Legionellales bacterium RIFCSPHIGHO2_12_FULL_37_14]
MDCVAKDITLTAAELGFIASTYYYVYAFLQIPVGMLFDKQNSRLLITASACLCSIGCLFFSLSQDFWHLTLARLIMGFGASFAFIGTSRVLREHFKPKQFSFMIGFSETMAFLVTVLFMFILGLLQNIHWRSMLYYFAILGITITLICYIILPVRSPKPNNPVSVWHALDELMQDKISWFNGLYVGLGFGFITSFGAMWAIPFIQLKTKCSLQTASIVDSMIFLGTALSCPIFGKIETMIQQRKQLMFFSYAVTAALMFIVIYVQITSTLLLGFLMLTMGISSGAYIISYSISNEIAPKDAQSTSIGFTNAFATITAPVLQPLIGVFLDKLKTTATYSLSNFQTALLIIPISLLIGAILGLLLPERRIEEINDIAFHSI